MNHLKDRPLPAGPAPQVQPPGRVLDAIALSDEVAELVEPRLEELAEVLPGLRTWRGFDAGAWVMGARTSADARRTTRADCSRVEFGVQVESGTRNVRVAFRCTRRGRDRATEHLTVALDEAGRERLADWIEEMLLGFAARWDERSA